MDFLSVQTRKRKAANGIWTSGTPKPRTALRDSFLMEGFLEPAVPLPTLTSTSSNLFEEKLVSESFDAGMSTGNSTFFGDIIRKCTSSGTRTRTTGHFQERHRGSRAGDNSRAELSGTFQGLGLNDDFEGGSMTIRDKHT